MGGMQDGTKQIADRVRGVAAQNRATQERIASILGMSRKAVSARMNGSVPYTGVELLTLSIAFGTDIAVFFPPVANRAAA
jgi:transcriptional regulator with XRE-family HTH domain